MNARQAAVAAEAPSLVSSLFPDGGREREGGGERLRGKRRTREKIRRTWHRFPSISRRSGPSAPTTDKFFVPPSALALRPFGIDDDGSLDEFKVNLGHETISRRAGERERDRERESEGERGGVGRRPRATCHREPPGSSRLTLISLLR